MRKKDIVTSVILCFITCGIYAVIWFVNITDDVIRLRGDSSMPTGITCFLLVLLTCGLYGIYWSYPMGSLLYQENQERGMTMGDNSIIYLILSILKLDIINYVLMQDNINKLVDDEG